MAAGKGGSQREDTTDLEKGKTEGSFGSSNPLRKGTTWNMSVLTTDSFKEPPELSKTDPVSTYDPVSLKEPPELHSWKWIGLPERWLRYMMHKIVLEVSGGSRGGTGQDEHMIRLCDAGMQSGRKGRAISPRGPC